MRLLTNHHYNSYQDSRLTPFVLVHCQAWKLIEEDSSAAFAPDTGIPWTSVWSCIKNLITKFSSVEAS